MAQRFRRPGRRSPCARPARRFFPRNGVSGLAGAVQSLASPDIGDEDWTGFVCIEGANAFENAVTVPPGESHTLTYRLEVEDG